MYPFWCTLGLTPTLDSNNILVSTRTVSASFTIGTIIEGNAMATLKLLLADKNMIFSEGLSTILEREPDFDVACICHTGLEAIQRSDEHQPDVILIDMELLECSGLEAIRRIHRRLPNANIIVLTHSVGDATLISALKAGARAYVAKEVQPKDLVQIIHHVANGEVLVTPPMASRLLTHIDLLKEHEDVAKRMSIISKREREVLSLIAQGLTNREVGNNLFISESTVKVHVRNIMDKLHAHTRQQAVAIVQKDLLSS